MIYSFYPIKKSSVKESPPESQNQLSKAQKKYYLKVALNCKLLIQHK